MTPPTEWTVTVRAPATRVVDRNYVWLFASYPAGAAARAEAAWRSAAYVAAKVAGVGRALPRVRITATAHLGVGVRIRDADLLLPVLGAVVEGLGPPRAAVNALNRIYTAPGWGLVADLDHVMSRSVALAGPTELRPSGPGLLTVVITEAPE